MNAPQRSSGALLFSSLLLLVGTSGCPAESDRAEDGPKSPPPSLPARATSDQLTAEQQAMVAVNRGNACAERDELDKAIADFTEAIRLSPEYAKAYYNRGVAYERKAEQPKAEADFAKAKELGYEPE